MWRNLRRKWWFWLGLSGGALALLAVLTAYAEWRITRSRGEARLATIVAKLDADDPNWRLHDLEAAHNAALPPPERNAAAQVEKAAALLPRSFHDWTRTKMWQSELQPGMLPAETDVATARSVHADCQAALAAARPIRQLPDGGFHFTFNDLNPIGSLAPHIDKLNQVVALLLLDAVVNSVQGRANEALRSCHAILNCGRAIGDEPFSISQVVRMAKAGTAVATTEKVLGWGEPTTGLAELQAAFAEELRAPRLTYIFRSERATDFHYLRYMDEGKISLADDDRTLPADQSPPRRFQFWWFRKDLPRQQAVILEKGGEWLAAAKLQGPARRLALRAVPIPDGSPVMQANALAAILMLSWDTPISTENRTRATLATAIAGLACERYRRKRGRWPPSLDAIPKEILPAIPTGPYTDGPLLYHTTDDGAMVSTAPPDRPEVRIVPIGSHAEPSPGVRFRLFNLDKRRQPAPPRDEAAAPANP
jgi:hypothetical protein